MVSISIFFIASFSSFSQKEERILRIKFNDTFRFFLLPPSTELLRQVVCREFALPPDAELSVSVLVSGSKVELVVPFDVSCLLPGDNLYLLKVYQSPISPSVASNKRPVQQVLERKDKQMKSEYVPFLSHQTESGLPHNHVKAIYNYDGKNSVELSFKAGDLIKVIGQYSEGWWKGEVFSSSSDSPFPQVIASGYFPANYVEGLENIQLQDGDDPLQDSEYFESYNTLLIHHQMLSDDARTLAYKQAVTNMAAAIKGKIVLDVGCGTGILSLFCAQIGAKHVYAVDASDFIAKTAQIVKANNMQDQITLIKGKIENICDQLPATVDIIISEWMGSLWFANQ